MVTGHDVEDFLAHYGKKGMKWGVKKASVSENSSEGPSTPRETPKYGKSWAASKGQAEAGAKKSSAFVSKTHTESKVDYEKRLSAERNEFFKKRFQTAVKAAKADGDSVYIGEVIPGKQHTKMLSGKTFLNEMKNGRKFDVTLTQVTHERYSGSEFRGVRNDYVESDRR